MNIDFLHNIYQQSLLDNNRNINFWEKYIADLSALDFKVYSDKLTVPTLVPIGSRVLFRGELKHTNEVTVALGADYFVKCSLAQAEVLRDHRIKDAKSKLEVLLKEKEYLEKQISFGQQSLLGENGHDIIEVCTEEEDKSWRQKHRENVRKYKQQKDKTDDERKNEMTEEEVWDRLEELELQEEIQNELSNIESEQKIAEYENDRENENKNENKTKNENETKNNNESEDKSKEPTEQVNKHPDSDDDSDLDVNDYTLSREELAERMRIVNESYTHFMHRPNLKHESKLELMHDIIGRHKLILETLSQFKKEKRMPCTNENHLLSKLDELEKVEELEDEMDRLEDMINECESEKEDEEEQECDTKLKKSVSFADEDCSETVQLTFKHSDVEPNNEPYNPEKGILKPSDIFEAYATKFNETQSILKKTNYVAPTIEKGTNVDIKQSNQKKDPEEVPDPNISNTIVLKDVVEKTDHNDNSVDSNKRPMSLFKKKRQQQKM